MYSIKSLSLCPQFLTDESISLPTNSKQLNITIHTKILTIILLKNFLLYSIIKTNLTCIFNHHK